MTSNNFDARGQLTVDNRAYAIYRIDRIKGSDRLPYSLKVLLENLLRNEDGRAVDEDDVRALAAWTPNSGSDREIAFTPARVR